jgi:hypothetical protein
VFERSAITLQPEQAQPGEPAIEGNTIESRRLTAAPSQEW